MAKKSMVAFGFDEEARKWMNNLEKNVQKASNDAVEAMGMVWSDNAKLMTRNDQHIDTGAYVNSIAYATSFPGKDGGFAVGAVINEKKALHMMEQITLGSGVSYAVYLEKRYNIFARSLDASMAEMKRVGIEVFKRSLGV